MNWVERGPTPLAVLLATGVFGLVIMIGNAARAENDAEEGRADGEVAAAPKPWDYDPYRVLIWIASADPRLTAESLGPDVREFLLRDYAAIWRMEVADAPAAVRSAAARGIDELDYDSLVASDPVLAVKKNHPDAIRIRFASDVGRYVKRVLGTAARIEDVKRRGATDHPKLAGVAERLVAIDGDAAAVRDKWAEESTEALLVSHGMALTLADPDPKIINLPIAGLVAETAERYDKVFVVQVRRSGFGGEVEVVEFDPLMQFFGPVVRQRVPTGGDFTAAIGRAVSEAFAPMVRIEESGTRTVTALLRAGGLILDEDSPGAIGVGDIVMPMLRKNDRNGNPIFIGPVEWAYLLVTEADGPKLTMDLHAGRAGGLQGRKNRRTFRTGIKVQPRDDATLLRLHARGEEDHPLIGYEVYQRELDSKSMTLVGRTDWNGCLRIEQTDEPLRLLYVKNGGAVLARLPMVPGWTERAVADLAGDDMRLQAEAYIRGVQNAIVDLVAIRELLAARIRLRIEQGEIEQAEELLNKLRAQPTNEKIADDMGRKQTMFLSAVGRNANQRRKIDEMFATTRDLLAKHISPRVVRELEGEVRQAQTPGAGQGDDT